MPHPRTPPPAEERGPPEAIVLGIFGSLPIAIRGEYMSLLVGW